MTRTSPQFFCSSLEWPCSRDGDSGAERDAAHDSLTMFRRIRIKAGSASFYTHNSPSVLPFTREIHPFLTPEVVS